MDKVVSKIQKLETIQKEIDTFGLPGGKPSREKTKEIQQR
jgi:hypothetical protein